MRRNEASSKRIFVWNALGSAVYALSSFLMLLFVARWCGELEAGVFSIGYAIAQLMLTIGVFEATVYFATDAGNRFSHEQYLAFKIVTCAAMIVISIFYVLSFGFDYHKAAVAYALCAFRLIEAFSQFWYAAFQKHERLDVGGFSSVWRMVLAMVAFAGVLLFNGDVVLACVMATVVEVIWVLAYDIPRLRAIVNVGFPDFSLRPLGQIFLACLPLFIASFLAAYLNNVPKYAIESVGTDAMQAVFNVLFMPAFIINLFLIFFMRPTLTTLAQHWLKKEVGPFMSILVRLGLITIGLTLVVILLCIIAGIPVLQWLYAIDLDGMLPALLILMLGGGFLSASNIMYNALVVIRAQQMVIIGYAVAIVVASLIATPIVGQQGVMGACITYCIASLALLATLAVTFIISAKLQLSENERLSA